MMRTARWIGAALVAAAVLGGCGKKEPPAKKAGEKAPKLSPTTSSLETSLQPPGGGNARDEMGFTQLHDAAARKKGITEALRAGADVNAKDKEIGWTALHWAAADGDEELIHTLLAHRANVNVGDSLGKTPLHVAAGEGQLKAVQALVAARANLNAADANGLTPLHHAVRRGDRDVVAYLLSQRVDVNARTKAGATALQMAVAGEKPEIADLLRRHGAAPVAMPNRADPLPEPPATTRPS